MSEPNTNLAAFIRRQIEMNGPMSLSAYMSLCLMHPKWGYYTTRDPLGRDGDFITAPEVSQMFGEMIGIWIAYTWQSLGRPAPFVLAELGPGRGTLMADALRALKGQTDMLEAMQLVLLEGNKVLREAQLERLGKFQPIFIEEAKQFDQFDGSLIMIANEFFDALPIRQYQWQDGKWHERLIGIEGDKLAWGLSPTPLDAALMPSDVKAEKAGEIFELGHVAGQLAAELAERIKARGGSLLAIDYGYDKTQTGNTFQALARHKMVDPLSDPGNADLTAHVNFDALMRQTEALGLQTEFLGTQGLFLKQLGIEQRAKTLMDANPGRASTIASELERLTAVDQMGELFKVMIVSSPQIPPHVKAASLDQHANVRHGFFGRRGGVSVAPFDSLNVSYMSGDDPAFITSNRAAIARSLDLLPERLATVKQTHSAHAIIVDEAYDMSAPVEADGLVTKTINVGLGILTADCTPILFHDPEAAVIGAAHAGWQGAVDGIVAATVSKMVELGAHPASIVAVLGPNISQANYEVGSDFQSKVEDLHEGAAQFFSKVEGKDKPHFDLSGFVKDRLREAGISKIEDLAICTYADSATYFSHRFATHQGTKTGRQLSVISLKG